MTNELPKTGFQFLSLFLRRTDREYLRSADSPGFGLTNLPTGMMSLFIDLRYDIATNREMKDMATAI